MSARGALEWYYSRFGIRGILTASAHRLFGRPKELSVRPRDFRSAIRLRIRTTDPVMYEHVLFGAEYAFDLPFSPKLIVDAGANIGMASIYFARRYPEAKIFAIEPEASNFAILVKNVRSYPAIIPVQATLWNRDGEIRVTEPDPASGSRGEWAFITCEEGTGAKVRAVTMRTLMEEMRIPAIDLAKIDIEGAEEEVFEDTGWLAGLGCLIIELHDRVRPGCSKAVERAMEPFERTQRGEATFYVRRTKTAA
jgi:FkbM family methyltransferase